MASGGRKFDVLGFGVTAVDELIELETMPAVDVKVDVRSHQTQCGGICVNALAAATRLGLRCHYAGPLGRNRLSQIVRDGMDAEGITYEDPLDDPDAGPCHAFILIDCSAGTRTILMNKARVRPMSGPLPDALLAGTRALYVDAWRAETGLDAVRRAAALGVQVFADFEEGDPERVRPMFPHVDHLILPVGYARRATGLDKAGEIIGALDPATRPCTAVTCGDDGCFFTTNDSPNRVQHQPAFKIQVVDTTGCGDAFHGAYVAAILNGRAVPDAIRFATAAAALCACAVGAQAGLPTHDQVERLLAIGIPV